MIFDKFLAECRRLAETTSVKGVSRVIKSNFWPTKLLWLVSVMVFIGLACFQAGILVVEYLDYPSVTNIEVHQLNLVNDTSVQLPQITVCNLNPLSSRAYAQQNDTISIDNFFNDLLELLGVAAENAGEDREKFKQLLYDFRRYYAHVGPELALVAGHTVDEFLVVCRVLVLQGLDMDEQPCDRLATVTQFQHPRHLNCYTVAMANRTPDNLSVGYSLTLHLANYNTRWYRALGEKKRYEMGAIVVLHEPGAYPNFHENGHHLAPGTHVNLRYNLQHQHRLPAPHGPCASDQLFSKFLSGLDVKLPFKYTKDLCISSNIGWNVAEHCNCTEHSLADILQHFVNYSICGMKGKPVRQRIDEINCATKHGGHKATAHFATLCPIPCHELSYRTEISQSHWPPDPLSPQFYDTMIKGRQFEHHYAGAARAIKEEEEAGGVPSAHTHYLAVELIRQNFVNIDVYLGKLALFNITDTPKLSVTSLMSLLGGILNLWAGITLVLAVEIMEFVLRVIFSPFTSKAPEQKVESPEVRSQMPAVRSEMDVDSKNAAL